MYACTHVLAIEKYKSQRDDRVIHGVTIIYGHQVYSVLKVVKGLNDNIHRTKYR